MSLHDFIFSNDRRNRLSRHLCFWLGWLLFSGIGQLTISVGGVRLHRIIDIILFQVIRSVHRLPAVLLFCYVTVYFLMPRFIPKRKYKEFVLSLLLFTVLLYIFTFLWFSVSINVLHFNSYMKNGWSLYVRLFNSFYSNINFTGPIPTCCLMLATKYYKDWYIKGRKTEQLNRENIQAELQMLKAQIHPHFLFNTLNNIYSFTLTGSPQAAGLVDKLSGMIDYMRTEGENSSVSLEKEIKLIKDYVGLEKVRYGDRLDLIVHIEGVYQNKLIAPLLMVPFVENCFKHGASVMRGNPWIKLLINLKGNELDFNLTNSKPINPPVQKNKKGIGLMNVTKRLQLLYPQKHSLTINSSEDVYSVHLSLTLHEEIASDTLQYEPTLNEAVYV